MMRADRKTGVQISPARPAGIGFAILITLASILGPALGSCIWRTHEEQRQMQARSYLRPVGQTAGTTITLQGDRDYTFRLDADQGAEGTRFGIEPGTYRITVRRGEKEEVVVSRVLYIADGETRELPVR
jgi:hypothetical protein